MEQKFDTIFTPKNILCAYKDCLVRKKNTVNALRFEIDRENNLSELLHELKTKTYKISRHICFIVTSPSPREIFAGDFRDRIVHHLLCNEIRDIFEREFIETSYANRIGKGTHAAMKKLRWHISRGGADGKKLYSLKLDIHNFFRSIDKKVLWDIISTRIGALDKSDTWKWEILWLAELIIFHDPASNYIYRGNQKLKRFIKPDKSLIFGNRNTGLPIGNLTSQFFANIYLNELDQFITKWLGCTRYVRYVDDFVIMDEDKDKLNLYIKQIGNFLIVTLNLHIHPRKMYLQPASHGIDFLGYFIKPTHTLVRQSVVRRFKDKLYHRRNQEDGLFSIDDIPMIQSYLGHLSHANTYNLREHLST